jgi:hypothetical protein
MARIALLTLEDRTGYVIDDAIVIEELRSRGHEVDEVPWSRPDADWSRYALAVIRTTWDYTERAEEFLAVLARIEAQVPLENPRSVVGWNLHKSYLRDLERRGVPIVPTEWGRGADALRAARDRTAARCVVKPMIGANAGDTFVIDPSTSARAMDDIAALYETREWMLQPFVRAVVEHGEHSLFYFSGVLSHTILKSPPDVRAAADRVIACLPSALLQARIDLVRLDDGTPALMEAELIEPSLYFRMHPDAPRHFADAIEARLARC